MYFRDAIQRRLIEYDHPVLTEYEFYRLILPLFESQQFGGEPIRRMPLSWDHAKVLSTIRVFERQHVFAPDSDFRVGVWRVVQATTAGTAEEACCTVDPFCYVSHLSAMQRYGLTDRAPDALHLSTPARPLWNKLREQKMADDFSNRKWTNEMPGLLRLGFKEKVRRRPVTVHETSTPALPAEISGERARIATIGRVFVDMLSEPALCGGIRHALDIWEREALTWLDDIVAAVELSTSKIVKVRAGYILSEQLGIEDARIETWAVFAQRGGSRKLDSDAPYAPIFSERWMLSLNV